MVTLCLAPSHLGSPSPNPVISSGPLWSIGVFPGIVPVAPTCPGEGGPEIPREGPQPIESQGLNRLTWVPSSSCTWTGQIARLSPDRLTLLTEAFGPLLLSIMAGKGSLTYSCWLSPLTALCTLRGGTRHHSCLPTAYSLCLFVNIKLKLTSCFIKVVVGFVSLYLMVPLPSIEHLAS